MAEASAATTIHDVICWLRRIVVAALASATQKSHAFPRVLGAVLGLCVFTQSSFKAFRVAELAQGFDFYLANALSGQLIFCADIVEGVVMTIAKAVAHLDDGALARGQHGHRSFDMFALLLLRYLVHRSNHSGIFQNIG